MGDRARISLDLSRRYRGIVKQQGRVTLEADDNEGASILDEAIRAETKDIVGPSGTPDDGYAITASGGPFDFAIGAGTMYVGGMRVFRPDATTYRAQTDWADRVGDPEWIPPTQSTGKPHDLVYLFLREQEVGAVEDTALREVALGGPDSAARNRLIQRVVRLGVNAADCPGAMTEAKTRWAALGLSYDDATLRLLSGARLQAAFQDLAGPADPCEPDAQGGYLGAQNQLIRVRISAANKVLWGFDNASFLYRVKALDNTTLELQSAPVDSFHFPRVGQAVEVLRTAATFDHDDVVASDTGIVQILGSAYNPDTRRITLPTALPADYRDATKTPVLFLRVWEEEKTFAAGTAVDLGTTGVQVTITGTAPFHIGAFWTLAVRPSTPIEIFPRRYLDAPQPPEGPREWACPLAVIGWTGGFQLIADCREPFDDLVELTKRRWQGCCTVTVGDGTTSVGQYKQIQEGVDAVEALGGGRVCVLPGNYRLSESVRIAGRDVIVSGCGGRSRIEAPDAKPAFILQNARDSGLESLTIDGHNDDGIVLVVGGRSIDIVDDEIRNIVERGDPTDYGPAVTVVTIDGLAAVDVTIKACRLAGLPAVTMAGRGLTLDHDQLIDGGVWVRDGSEDVRIRDNDIGIGEGPGILLGGRLRDEPPARDLAGIERVRIDRNRIDGMSASGITTWAPPSGDELFSDEYRWSNHIQLDGDDSRSSLIFDVDLADNDVTRCVRSAFADSFDHQAVGGMVLRHVAGLRVHANHIVGNGADGPFPTCGVFLHTCLGSELTGNTILDNGPRETGDESGMYQGGIVGLLLVAGSQEQGTIPRLGHGPPAALVHDNIVVSPRGQALLAVAIGSVSVADNTLTTLDLADQPFALAARGRAVFIFDLGRMPTYVTGRIMYGISTGLHHEMVGAGGGVAMGTTGGLTGFPDGRVLVHGNQIDLVAQRDAEALVDGGIVVASLDDVSLQDNQTQIEAPGGMWISAWALGLTVRAAANRFTELPYRALFSYVSFGLRNSATGNQATHCLLVAGPQHIDHDNQVLLATYCQLFSP